MTTPGSFSVDERTTLYVEHPNRYIFGDPAAPLLVLNDVDEFGCAWVVDEPEGWDAASVDTPMDRRQDGHGGILGESYLLERTLTFSDGLVTAPSTAALHAARDRWRTAVQAALDDYVLYTHVDEPKPWSLWLRPTGRPKFLMDDRSAIFSMVMVAEDPVKFGPTQTYGPARLPTGTGDPGRTYAKSYPYSYGGTDVVAPDVIKVPNGGGDEYGHAIYAVTGPVPQPKVLVSTGETFGLTIDLGELDTLELDTLAGTLQINGVNRPDALAPGSTFPLIPPAGAEVRLRSAIGASNQAASLTVTTAPRTK